MEVAAFSSISRFIMKWFSPYVRNARRKDMKGMHSGDQRGFHQKYLSHLSSTKKRNPVSASIRESFHCHKIEWNYTLYHSHSIFFGIHLLTVTLLTNSFMFLIKLRFVELLTCFFFCKNLLIWDIFKGNAISWNHALKAVWLLNVMIMISQCRRRWTVFLKIHRWKKK